MFNWILKAHELQESNTCFAIVSVAEVKGSAPRDSGAKMIVKSRGEFWGTIGGGVLEKTAIEMAISCMQQSKSELLTIDLTPEQKQCCGGTAKIFVETIGIAPQINIFEVSHVGQAICNVLKGTSFSIAIVDERDEWISRVPAGCRTHKDGWMSFISQNNWNRDNYSVILTHSHEIDYGILKQLIKIPHKYLGVIGSQNKWRRFQQSLKTDGYSSEEISAVICPIGLPVGGKSPQEVAISFAAQLLSIYNTNAL